MNLAEGLRQFPDLGAGAFPSLHCNPARTIARDRWERLETSIEIPSPPEVVWHTLTEPGEIAHWLGVCRGSLTNTDRDVVLDFEDGEFFLVRPVNVVPNRELKYLTRWLGIGQATAVTWYLEPIADGTRVTVTEEARNPPWDWQTWNGGGWPGILDQFAARLRTGTTWRWPWRRMGPYAQIELPVSVYEAWDRLFGVSGTKYWLVNKSGSLAPGSTISLVMGDASGVVDMSVDTVVQPGQEPPSFLPYLIYRLRRQAWGCDVFGRLWLEPAGWGRSLLQVFHMNWEGLPGDLQLSERKLLCGYWAECARRALQYICMPQARSAPHNW